MAVDREFDVYILALLLVDREMIEAEPLLCLPAISTQVIKNLVFVDLGLKNLSTTLCF